MNRLVDLAEQPLLDLLPDAVVAIDDRGRIVLANAHAEALFGHPRERLVGESIELLVPERFRASHAGHRAGYFADPRTRPMGAGLELFARRADGSEFPAEISLSSLPAGDGRTLAIAAVRDITERRLAENRFQQLLDFAPDAIIGIDGSGRIVLANAQAEEIFGYARREMLGRPIETLVPERFRDRHGDHRAAYFGDPRTRPMGAGLELFARRADGSEFPAEISLSSLETERGVIGLAAVRDVTDRHLTERRLAAQHSELEQFAYVVSHDLSEPLRTMTSFAQLLAGRYRDDLDAQGQEFLGFIVDGATRMQELLDALLEYTRAGSAELRRRPVALGGVVADALRALSSRVEAAGATVEVGEMPVVDGDPVLLTQLLQNLIANAVKFGDPDAPRVTITARPDADGWRVEVADNGIGVDPRQADRLFRVFQRLHGREAYDGTGIGLAICRKIVESHGGTIRVEPEPGPLGGAVFAFTLPASGDAAAAASSAADGGTTLSARATA